MLPAPVVASGTKFEKQTKFIKRDPSFNLINFDATLKSPLSSYIYTASKCE